MALIIGGLALGAGFGAGHTLMLRFLYEEADDTVATAPPPPTSLTSVRIHPLTAPIDTEVHFVDIIPQIQASVVSIRVITEGRGGREATGSGSGFIFDASDEYVYIATNNHVIADTLRIYISPDDEVSIPAELVGADRTSDLAVISARIADLERHGIYWAIAPFGDSNEMRMGDPVIAIGNALGEGQTVTQGIISALGITITINDPGMAYRLNLDVLQTDAAVNRGNSGGPLVNIHGEVIGVVTAKLLGADIEGMGYALPAADVYPILLELKEEGSLRQPFIGIVHEEFSEMRRRLFNLPSTGMMIVHVFPDSPAEEAGLQMGDLIVFLDERRTADFPAFVEILNTLRPDETVVFGIYRAGVRMDINVILGPPRDN
jgi:serine protease Do